MKKFISDFSAFLKRGNVLDLAVAVIIGGAFTKIVNSLVKDILTPILSLIIGQSGFANYKFVITPADAANGIAENAIYYGVFIQNVIDFVVVALIIFIIIRIVARANRLFNERKAKEIVNTPAPKPLPTVSEQLLTEIRDLLKSQQYK